MDCANFNASPSDAYWLLLSSLSLIPFWHYVIAAAIAFVSFVYNLLEFHFLEVFLSAFRGSPVGLTYHSCSEIYDGVVSKCSLLHGRYFPTFWLSSPHVQTCFLNFFGRPPIFQYNRQLYKTSDGGTIALDWLRSSDVSHGALHGNGTVPKDDPTPLVLVIPGLTSDSSSAYLKHLAFRTAKQGWNVVISNHRGLGGVSITSDCFYNAGWTEDARAVIRYLHEEYPGAPLFVIGTSIGANVLVKYLGEEGENIPVAGAVAICSPWDLLIGDRFISRKLVQKLYDRALALGLQGYARMHRPHFTRLANWEGIEKTVDTFYRRCSSSIYIQSVAVPLLCISALDDPVCTREAIPWDECRANKNVVLATTKHGGHLAFFEGITASSLWWVRAANEFLGVLHTSKYMHVQKEISKPHTPWDTPIDQGPYVNLTGNGMVAASEQTTQHEEESHVIPSDQKHQTHERIQEEQVEVARADANCDDAPSLTESPSMQGDAMPVNVIAPFKRYLGQLTRQSRWSIWLLLYIAITTSWPLLGSALRVVFGKRLKGVLPDGFLRR